MMMWCVMTLMAFALSVESYSGHDFERLSYGRKLKIYLSKNTDKLIFIPEKNPSDPKLYWTKGQFRAAKGQVTGTGNDRQWYIEKVTFEDKGTYVQKDFWNHEISSIAVDVTPKISFVKHVAGETLRIQLEGLKLEDASLKFYGEFTNETLVNQGAPMSQNNPYYHDRVKTYSTYIDIKEVNYTDVGQYILVNNKRQTVSITKMELTDHHESTGGNPLLALLLLLGIPAGICCCCRKKIFKKKATPATALQTTTEIIHQPPSGPVGPSPPYSPPGQPGVMHYNNQFDPSMGSTIHPPPNAGPGQNGPAPSPGFNPAYPPQNLAYNPAAPATYPPGQPPQWNGPPPGPYPMGPGAPMGYAPVPVMYSAAPPTASEAVKQEIKMENMASSPTTALMSTAPQPEVPPAAPVPPSSTNALSSSDGDYKFQIEGKNNSTNFL